MGRSGVKAIWAVVAILALVACGGGARAQMETHAEVLVSVARKGFDVVRAGRLTAESMPELTYPLERARAFAVAERARTRLGPEVLAAFDALVERYRDFVDALDRVRREHEPAAAAAALAQPLRAVEAAAAAVRARLDGRGG